MALSFSLDLAAEDVARRIVYAAAKAQGASEDEARAIEAVADSALRTAFPAKAAGETEGQDDSVRLEMGFDGDGFILQIYEPEEMAPLNAMRRPRMH